MSNLLPDWPMFGLSDDVRPAMRQARDAGSAMVLATLMAVDGGGPRPEGTQMLYASALSAAPLISGYFSGGCVEADVADHAARCLAGGEPRTLVYGEGSPWPDIKLLCGARLEIFLERISADDPALDFLLTAEQDRCPVTWVSDGRTRACAPDLSPWPEAVLSRRHDPPLRLVVVGGDPTAIAIAALGAQAGMQTTLVRPKGPATPPPVAGVAYLREAAGPALAALDLDPWTAVAIATHDLETDQEALKAALPSRAGYVGLLGARRRLPERLAPLKAAGVPDAVLERLHAPIGLPIGGKAPWEVAVSVIGEVMQHGRAQARSRASNDARSPAAAAGALA